MTPPDESPMTGTTTTVSTLLEARGVLPQNKQKVIDGVTVDINNVYATDWGQWTPGQSDTVTSPAPPAQQPALDVNQILELLRRASSL